MDTELQHISFI